LLYSSAKLLLDQYRKKSELYNQNSLFVQLGDDFRYTSLNEANTQFENYEKLIDYMNSRKDWFVNIKFGTLRDYFKLIDDGIQNNGNKFSTLNGDFFTYADRQDHYWSGYYTSRPLYKRLDRIVEYYLRSAEILFSYLNVFNKNDQFKNDLYKKLLVSRRNLGRLSIIIEIFLFMIMLCRYGKCGFVSTESWSDIIMFGICIYDLIWGQNWLQNFY
jgi:alpha-mannosidase II